MKRIHHHLLTCAWGLAGILTLTACEKGATSDRYGSKAPRPSEETGKADNSPNYAMGDRPPVDHTNRTPTPAQPTPNPVPPDRSTTPNSATSTMTDGEILATIMAVDSHEVEVAGLAQEKNASPAITEFATMMHDDHQSHLKKATELAASINTSPRDNSTVTELKAKGADEVASLKALDGEEFSKAFVTAMTKGHQDVLDLIDSKLMPAAQNAQVKTFLTDTRKVVADHLAKAKALQQPGS
jgi:putative membrane protein